MEALKKDGAAWQNGHYKKDVCFDIAQNAHYKKAEICPKSRVIVELLHLCYTRQKEKSCKSMI